MDRLTAIRILKQDKGLYQSENCWAGDGSPDGELILALEMAIDTLDAIEQGRLIEQKRGRWIYKHDEEGNTGNAQYECSECGAGDLHAKSQEVPYCWKCGSYMLKKLEGAK